MTPEESSRSWWQVPARFIALLGLLNILGVFLGVGYYFLYAAFAGTVDLADMKSVVYYLFITCSVELLCWLFNLANQLQRAFSSSGAVPQGLCNLQPAAAPVLVRGSDVGSFADVGMAAD